MATGAVDAESPTLAEILSLHGLEESDLDRECLLQDRNEIAVKLEDWKMVGHFLDFQPAKLNQAHTCKTLGVVTKPMSIASTHAQMHPRNIIHARAILISYSRPRPAPKDAGRGREYEV